MHIHIGGLDTYADRRGSKDEEDDDIHEFHDKANSIIGLTDGSDDRPGSFDVRHVAMYLDEFLISVRSGDPKRRWSCLVGWVNGVVNQMLRLNLVLIRSLYQAAMIGDGDEMIDKMKSAGCCKALDKKEYYGFLKILCGIERLEHVMIVFKNMKADGSARRGVEISPKEYRVDPRFLKKKSKEVDSNVKKRETLREKTARKRSKQINMSFVKKPHNKMED
ncbi:hypothetical protein F2Q70_00018890 [Brassica cretica]|uniref:Uncharacterized protein n=1 Tax=Brassica cretica TaxID=69181 RepID=A0A8S9I3D3_BRACR|nr:hypothetical protein F2Q70_00018890 [Brassica cretica]